MSKRISNRSFLNLEYVGMNGAKSTRSDLIVLRTADRTTSQAGYLHEPSERDRTTGQDWEALRSHRSILGHFERSLQVCISCGATESLQGLFGKCLMVLRG